MENNQRSDKGRGKKLLWLLHRLEEPFNDECVIWPFAKVDCGYGGIWYKGGVRRVHQLVLELTTGGRPLSPHNNALHSCDTPSCFNLNHLAWGSLKENSQQRQQRGRTVMPSRRKIRNIDIKYVFELKRMGYKQKDIATEFNVSSATITQILKRFEIE